MAYERKRDPLSPCALELVLGQIGGKWKVRILDALRKRPSRFAELRAALSGISQQVLTTQLTALHADGLVAAQPITHRGQAVRLYTLTEGGRDLVSALEAVAAWGDRRLLKSGSESERITLR